ncbi:magnesium transporter MRS2-I isoform X2 [Selaginella moellendorffii]|uniref:magnesium transporter MRS2-I isoform X2 n=1 Tax=Selaginella moellendorffii TaxID=88036 RepID=UPI000D1CBCFB|nr:magnesium transporter MRS2-I isoform X2 [Selaginella moellendorffii]|eukprot:XP_024530031.1 magnesium transporter MRS2-I isoform X2 [Selaginella moellendorffii]
MAKAASPGADLGKKGMASRIWCVLDSNGEPVTLDMDKAAVMHRAGIHARDLRILDPLLSYPSTILGRERAIVLNLEHIKAIITAEEVLLRNPTNEHVIPIVEELRRRLPLQTLENGAEALALLERTDSKKSGRKSSVQSDPERGEVTPFEFRALEVALEAICSFLDARTTELETSAYPALDELTSKISSRNLDRVRKLKSGMTRLISRVQKVRDELEQLLDDDDDMAELFLTRKAGSSTLTPALLSNFPASPVLGSKLSAVSRTKSLASTHGSDDDVEEVEMLLEVLSLRTTRFICFCLHLDMVSFIQCYFMQVDGTLNKLNTLREYIDDTEDYINIQLELVLNAATLAMALYSLVAGIFGMNIPYPWNDDHAYIFKWVVVAGCMLCVGLFSIVMAYARHKGLVGT